MQMQPSFPYDPPFERVPIVIPAYNEAMTIRELVEDALDTGAAVIVVDDGSTDGTLDRLRGLPVTRLRHEANLGKAAALRTAFHHALCTGAVAAVALDGDGQHDPADAGALVRAWRHTPSRIVIGSRLHDRRHFPLARWLANRFACFWISWASGHRIADSQSGFRVYPREVMRLALGDRVRSHGFTFESEILIEAAAHGHETHAVAIAARYPGDARPSHFRPVADITGIVLMVAARLLAKGLHPVGLWRIVRRRKAISAPCVVPHTKACAVPRAMPRERASEATGDMSNASANPSASETVRDA
jgi:glycosyltransferase involved in cell wall biosynthesis